MKKKPKMLKSIRRWLTAVLVTLCILSAVLLCYTAMSKAAGEPLPTVFGWGSAVVLSGSMEPELPVGSLLWIHQQDAYESGDVVTYEENGTLVTHRLVSITKDTAVTKGDANNAEDYPIDVKQIRGKVSAVWPGVGSMLLVLKSPAGIICLLLFCGITLFLPYHFIKKGGKNMKRYKPKHLKKRHRKGIGRISILCLCVVVVVTGVTLSKMVSTAAGSANAEAAAFIVEASGAVDEGIVLDCKTQRPQIGTYAFDVTNAKDGKAADVAMKYDVVITLKQALPSGLSMTIPTKDGELSGTASSDGLTYTFSSPEWVFDAGTVQTHSHTVKITAQEEIIDATWGSTISLAKISVGIHAEQLD